MGDFLLFACEELRTQGIYQCKSGYPVLWYTFGGYPWSRPIPRHSHVKNSSWMEGMGADTPFLSTGISPMFWLIQSVIIQEKKNIKRNIKDAGEKKMQVGEGRRKHKDPSSSMTTCYGFHFKPTHFPFQPSRMEATFIFLLSYPSLLELVCPKTIKTLILIQSVANYMLHYGSFWSSFSHTSLEEHVFV